MAEKFDTFLVKKDGKWLHVKEKWVDGQEVARKALQDKGFETGTAMRDAKDRWVNVPDSQVEKAMEMGLHIPSAGSPTQKTQEDFKAEREAKQAAEPQSPYLTAAMEGTDSLMFNQLPNVSGALVGAKEALTGGSFQEGFDGQRQAVIDAMAKGRKDNPIVANATAMAADFANPINPLGKFKGAAKGIQALAKHGSALPTLVRQAGESAFRSLGHAGSGEEVLTDAALGGGLGALGEGLTSKLVKDRLQQLKIKMGGKAMGANKSQHNKLGTDKIDKAVNYAIENDLVKTGATGRELVDLVDESRKKSGSALGEVRKALGESDLSITPEEVAARIINDGGELYDLDRLSKDLFKSDKKFAKTFLNDMVNVKGKPELGFGDLMSARKTAKFASNYNKGASAGTTHKEDMAREAGRTLNRIIQEKGNAMGGGLGDRFRVTNRDYELHKTLQALTDNKMKMEEGNHLIGLGDLMMMGAGGSVMGLNDFIEDNDPTGGILGGAGALALTHMGRKYAPGATANAVKKLQKQYGGGLGKSVRSIFDTAGNRAIQGQDEKDKEAAVNRHLSQ